MKTPWTNPTYNDMENVTKGKVLVKKGRTVSMKIEIKTKLKPYRGVFVSDILFHGTIQKGYFPVEGKELFYVSCSSFGGGTRDGKLKSPLDVLDMRSHSRKALISDLRSFCLQNKLFFFHRSCLR